MHTKYKGFVIAQATDMKWPDEVVGKWLGRIDSVVDNRYVNRRYVTPDGTLADRCGEDVWFKSPSEVRTAIDRFF